jgi:hypothetical protein
MLVDNLPTLLLQKAQWRAAKRDELRRINLDEYGNMHVTLRTLKIKHFKPMFHRAHVAAFATWQDGKEKASHPSSTAANVGGSSLMCDGA